MSESVKELRTRRQVFLGALRNAGLAVLGLGGGAAVMKRRRLLRDGACLNRGICAGCDVFDQCGLPRALSVKRATRRDRDGQ